MSGAVVASFIMAATSANQHHQLKAGFG